MLNKIKQYINNNKLLFFIFLFFIILHLPLLDHTFLLRGKRDITLTGYALAHSGKDLYGNLLQV